MLLSNTYGISKLLRALCQGMRCTYVNMRYCVYVEVIVQTHIRSFIILTLITLAFSSPGFHLSESACINICFRLW